MATEKILNTRIQLKYDKYETWVEQNPTLKSGELAIAYLSTSHTTTSPDNGTHAVMFKVGPGAFNSLPWASALAADVYDWAKRSEAEFATNFLAMQDSNGETMQTKLDNLFVTPDELSTALSNLQTNVLTDLSNRVKAIEDDYLKNVDKTELEGKITAEESRAEGEEARIEGLVTAEASRADAEEKKLAGLIADNAKDIAEIVDAENGILAQAKADATSKADAAKSSAEATAAAALATAKAEISAEIDADVKAEADRAKGVETGLQSAIDAINGNDGILKQAKDYVDGEIDKVEAAIEDVIDGTTPVAKATDADKLGGVAATDYATKAYADQAETDAIAAAKEYTDGIKDAILGDGIKDTFDTLVEIQNWIEGDGVNATELTEAIAAEASRAKAAEEKIAKFDEKGALVSGALFTEVDGLQDQIDALGIADGKVSAAAKADVASSLDAAGVTQVQGIKVNNATNADKANSLTDAAKAEVKAVKVDNASHADSADAATKATQDGNGAVISETYETKTDAAQKLTDATAYADDLIAALDVDDTVVAGKYVSGVKEVDGKIEVSREALPTYTLTPGETNGTVKFNDTEVAVKGLGSAAYTDASAYATAAQGTKADTALQSIKTGTGLKVSEKAGNEQTIDIDDTVTFVFNCGTASTII